MDFGLLADKKTGLRETILNPCTNFPPQKNKLDSYKRKDKNVEIYFNRLF